MKCIRIILCVVTVFQTVQGIISPTRIGELQELQKKIASGALAAAEAQKLFKLLVEPLSEADKKDSLVTRIVAAAEAKQIPLFLQNIEITRKVVDKSLEQKKEMEQKNVHDKNILTEVELARITGVMKILKPVYKSEPLDRLAKAIDAIKKAVHSAVLPKELFKDFNSIRTFKIKLARDLEFIGTLGDEQNNFFDTVQYKNKETDTHAVKEFIASTELIEADIKAFLKIYPNNKNIEDVVEMALKNLTKFLYKGLKRSMQKASESADNSQLRKLIRIYARAVELFPIYSEKHFEKDEEKKQSNMNVETLHYLIANGRYRTVDLQEVEQKLAIIEPYESLLNNEDLTLVDEVKYYVDASSIHVNMLADINKFLDSTEKFIATKSTDTNMQKIDRKFSKLIAVEGDCESILQEQTQLKGVWMLERVKRAQERSEKIGASLEQLAKIAEKKEEIEALSTAFEQSQSEQIKESGTSFDHTPEKASEIIRPALQDKTFADSPNEAKIKKQNEERDKEFVRQHNEALDAVK